MGEIESSRSISRGIIVHKLRRYQWRKREKRRRGRSRRRRRRRQGGEGGKVTKGSVKVHNTVDSTNN
jgi:hypothetical protein